MVGIFLSGCLELNPVISTQTDSLPDTATIEYSNILYYPEENLSIRFIDVLSESRCPTSVQCFWEGVAEIELGVQIKSNPEIKVPIEIFGYVDIEDSERQVFVDTLSYRIILMGLSPYPSEPGEYDYTKYVATISIFKITAG